MKELDQFARLKKWNRAAFSVSAESSDYRQNKSTNKYLVLMLLFFLSIIASQVSLSLKHYQNQNSTQTSLRH